MIDVARLLAVTAQIFAGFRQDRDVLSQMGIIFGFLVATNC